MRLVGRDVGADRLFFVPAGKARILFAALAKEPFVVRERGSDTWNSMREVFGSRLAKLNIAMEIKSTETIVHFRAPLKREKRHRRKSAPA